MVQHLKKTGITLKKTRITKKVSEISKKLALTKSKREKGQNNEKHPSSDSRWRISEVLVITSLHHICTTEESQAQT